MGGNQAMCVHVHVCACACKPEREALWAAAIKQSLRYSLLPTCLRTYLRTYVPTCLLLADLGTRLTLVALQPELAATSLN